MKIFECIVFWPTFEVEFIFPARNSQEFLNELRSRLLEIDRLSTDFKFGDVREYY